MAYNKSNNNNNTNNINVFVNVRRITIKGVTFELVIKSADYDDADRADALEQYLNSNLEQLQKVLSERIEVTSVHRSGKAKSDGFSESADW